MLTPAFELLQDDNFLTIYIKAPYAKISETELFIDGCEFKFYSKPYYLRLTLPGEIVEDGKESAQYDSSQGSFTVKVPKVCPGEHFEGLDMITKLLAPSGSKTAMTPLIEVLDGDACTNSGPGSGGEAEPSEDEEDDEDIDWQIEQEPYIEEALMLSDPKYGFANQRSGVLKRLQAELHDIIDLKDADRVPTEDRRKLRLAEEECNFDDDHYLADLYQDEGVQHLLSYRPPWDNEYIQLKSGAKVEDIVELTDEDKELMRKLPRKEYLLDKNTQQSTFLGLVDLVFAYAYNHRTTEGENTVESSWTVAKLSATLSWLETYTSVRDAVVTTMRRCLTYPLYRHWKLVRRVLRDTQKIFVLGRRRLLKCLLDIHRLLLDTESRYILNDLYITDYCVWIQSVSSRYLKSLAKSLTELKIDKEDLGLDLTALEQAAVLALDEAESQTEILCQGAEQLSITDHRVGSSGDVEDSGRSVKQTSQTDTDDVQQLTNKINSVKVSEFNHSHDAATPPSGENRSPVLPPGGESHSDSDETSSSSDDSGSKTESDSESNDCSQEDSSLPRVDISVTSQTSTLTSQTSTLTSQTSTLMSQTTTLTSQTSTLTSQTSTLTSQTSTLTSQTTTLPIFHAGSVTDHGEVDQTPDGVKVLIEEI